MANIRICFSYMHTDAPLDGSNNFTRALRQYVSSVPGFTITDNLHSDFDILFMNQLSRAPGKCYDLSDVRALLENKRGKKLVVRAVNLKRNCHSSEPKSHFMGHYISDRPILDLLNMADYVIFQSTFQRGFFDRFGYKGKNDTIIHNGASPAFLNVPAGAKRLGAENDLILISSAMATIESKRQDIIAAFSLVPGVKIIHIGAWPKGLDKAKVELVGVLSHEAMARLYEQGHYFLHPAIRDVCPNSLIEGLCAGLPTIYNSGPGSGSELASKFGIPLNEENLLATVAEAREKYVYLTSSLAAHRLYYSIDRAAADYLSVFKTALQR